MRAVRVSVSSWKKTQRRRDHAHRQWTRVEGRIFLPRGLISCICCDRSVGTQAPNSNDVPDQVPDFDSMVLGSCLVSGPNQTMTLDVLSIDLAPLLHLAAMFSDVFS